MLPLQGVTISVATQETREDGWHRRWRETSLFGVALLCFAVVFGVALWIAFIATAVDAATRQSATAIVVTLVGALGGFLGGRASK